MTFNFARKTLALAIAAGFSFAGTAPALAANADKVVSVEFTPTPTPRTEAELTSIYTRSSAIVTYASGARKVFPLSHHTLFRIGDKFAGGEAGLVVDKSGQSILISPADDKGVSAVGPFHAYSPDANSLMRVGKDGKLFLVTHYEYHTESPLLGGKGTMEMYAQLPMAMSLTQLTQDKKSGILKASNLKNIPMGAIGGLWIPCAGSLSPWNTHLGGEEYEPNARQFETEPLEAMNLYLGTAGRRFDQGGANPYRYGFTVEVAVKEDASTSVVKRYAMGRRSTELAEVMPDGRTVYFGDDGRDTMMFMFVADRERDLSAGSLYAARWEQTDAENGGKAQLKWVKLGHANEAEIKALVDGNIRFSDIFEAATPDQVKAEGDKFKGFVPVYVYEGQAGKRAPGSGAKQEVAYLKVKPGMEKAAAFLEPRRYGAILGASSEFTKMEGVTHNAADRKLYVAMSYIEAGMIDGQNGERPQDHIRLKGDAKDLSCGGVYQAALAGGQSDAGGAPIASEWVAASMEALVLGARKPFGQLQGPHDKCDTERMANPDNIKYSPQMRTLFIGEDSGNHLNNFVWAYQMDSGSLTRILSGPAGAEHTGLQVVPDVGGHAYIMGNIQHPGAATDLKSYPDSIKKDLRAKVDQRGSVGYLGGLPAMR